VDASARRTADEAEEISSRRRTSQPRSVESAACPRPEPDFPRRRFSRENAEIAWSGAAHAGDARRAAVFVAAMDPRCLADPLFADKSLRRSMSEDSLVWRPNSRLIERSPSIVLPASGPRSLRAAACLLS